MICIHLTYEIDPAKVKEFETYARQWISLLEKFGGKHHGYFLPAESSNHIAYALFSFKNLSAYEAYRIQSREDEACRQAYLYAEQTGCIRHYHRAFMKPIF